MLQLNPALPLDTPRGPAYAHFVIDYSQEHYLLFVCFLMDSGECWIYPNRDVRAMKNPTMGVRPERPHAAPPPASVAEVLTQRWQGPFASNGSASRTNE